MNFTFSFIFSFFGGGGLDWGTLDTVSSNEQFELLRHSQMHITS